MSQVNVNPSSRESSSGSSTAAGINLIAVLLVVAALAVFAWFLFTGPLRTMSFGQGGTTNINVNPPAQQQPNVNVNPPNVNPPGQQQNP